MIAVWRRFGAYVVPYRAALGVGAALTLLGVALSLAQPWPLKYIVDDVLVTGGPQGDDVRLRLGVAVVALVGVVALGALCDYWATRLLSGSGLNIANDLRVDVLDRLQRLSLQYHTTQRVGDLVSRATSDVAYTQDMVVQTLATLLPSAVLVIGMFVVMLTLDAWFTLLALLATPPLAYLTHRSRRELRLAARRQRKADGALASSATESLSSVHLIQAFTMEDARLHRFSSLSDEALGAGLESVRLQARLSPTVEVAAAMSTAVVLWFGAQRVLGGHLEIGSLLVFVAYVGSLYKPVRALSKASTVLSRGAAAAERIAEVLDTPPDIVDRPFALPVRVRGTVEFRGVSFSYGREPVLEDVSFSIAPGQRVAIVGPTGAGKSTIAALIPRLLDVDAGAVFVDGIDVRDHPLASLRRQISLVLQDTGLLDGTLRDNIVCARPGVREADVDRAVAAALVDEFATRLPDGLDTRVGERGVSLSGGQRQRVAIARAIVRDAPITILDEPTSALDAASEELIVAALRNLPADRTTIVIAHRLSTIRDVDRVVVFERGRVVEQGTPDALAGAGGLYARLHDFQLGRLRLVSAGA